MKAILILRVIPHYPVQRKKPFNLIDASYTQSNARANYCVQMSTINFSLFLCIGSSKMSTITQISQKFQSKFEIIFVNKITQTQMIVGG
ncbi:UNKNOWN [Stylonychia lemnae]|uniref:Uncharacterized protein n=1 Tax=Stylonychia lemnae TaxID=5949 RepID=A0A078AMZ3_STYLE|nr:UNKNOWN [Stylonychia lemnae]|eukprot:CDW83740.1 UNKNOWN [Stylonychia lemnae]